MATLKEQVEQLELDKSGLEDILRAEEWEKEKWMLDYAKSVGKYRGAVIFGLVGWVLFVALLIWVIV